MFVIQNNKGVSIHAPAWGATLNGWKNWLIQRFQSTPPHGGRHTPPIVQTGGARVSIHAPAWGATPFGWAVLRNGVFQSTPPHGGRLGDVVTSNMATLFQSTPPHGGRPAGSLFSSSFCASFNPRPRMGGDSTSGR